MATSPTHDQSAKAAIATLSSYGVDITKSQANSLEKAILNYLDKDVSADTIGTYITKISWVKKQLNKAGKDGAADADGNGKVSTKELTNYRNEVAKDIGKAITNLTIYNQDLIVDKSANSVDEGDSVLFTLHAGEHFVSGLAYTYTITGVQPADVDGPLTGTVLLGVNGTAQVSVKLIEDHKNDTPPESVKITFTDTVSGLSGSSDLVAVNDTSVTPTYTLQPNVTSVDEGGTIVYAFQVINLDPAQKTFPYTISGQNLSASDVEGSLTGTVTVDDEGKGFITVKIAEDHTTETQPENLVLTIGGAANIAASAVTINDTSKTPTFTITPNANSVAEGSSITYTVATTGVPEGATLSYQIGGQVSSDDIVGGQLGGQVTIDDNGNAVFTVHLDADHKSDGGPNTPLNESMVVSLLDTTATSTVTVLDTSLDPTFALSQTVNGAVATSVDEGQTVIYTLQTTGIATGTPFDYTISGVQAEDVVGGQLSGTAFIDATGKAVIPVTLRADNSLPTEGAETMTFIIDGKETTITVNDTSKITGLPFELSPGTDSIDGSSGNDTISGFKDDYDHIISTLGQGDIIHGNAGVDTLLMNLGGGSANINNFTADGVEIFKVHSTTEDDSNLDLSGVAHGEGNLEKIVSEGTGNGQSHGGDLTFTDIQQVNGIAIEITDTQEDHNFFYDLHAYESGVDNDVVNQNPSASTSDDDVVDLTLKEVGGLDNGFHETTDINFGTTGGDSGDSLIEELDIHSLGNEPPQVGVTPSFANKLHDLNVGDDLWKLVIDGDANLLVSDALDQNISLVDASGLDANLWLDMSNSNDDDDGADNNENTQYKYSQFPSYSPNGDIDNGSEEGPEGVVNVEYLGAQGNDHIDFGETNNFKHVHLNTGNDWVNTGTGHSFVEGGLGNDTIYTGSLIDTVYGDNEGDDDNGGNDHVVDEGANTDYYYGDPLDGTWILNQFFNMGAGHDTLEVTGDANNYAELGIGNDSMEVLGSILDGDNTVIAGTGNDTVHIHSNGDTKADLGAGNDILVNEHVQGLDENDDPIAFDTLLRAGADNDTVTIYGDGNVHGYNDSSSTAINNYTAATGDAGDDQITIFGNGVHNIDLGSGDDLLVINGARNIPGSVDYADNVNHATTVDGGSGDDTVDIDFTGSGSNDVAHPNTPVLEEGKDGFGIEGEYVLSGAVSAQNHVLDMNLGTGSDHLYLRANDLTTGDTISADQDSVDGDEGHETDTMWLSNATHSVTLGKVLASETRHTTGFERYELTDSNVTLVLTDEIIETSDDKDDNGSPDFTVSTLHADHETLPQGYTQGMTYAQYIQKAPIKGAKVVDSNDNGIKGDTSTIGGKQDTVYFVQEEDGAQTVDMTQITVPDYTFTLEGGSIRDIVIANDASVNGDVTLHFGADNGQYQSEKDTLRIIDGAEITSADLQKVDGMERIELVSSRNDAQEWTLELTDNVINQTTGPEALRIYVDPNVAPNSKLFIELDASITNATNDVFIYKNANVQVYITNNFGSNTAQGSGPNGLVSQPQWSTNEGNGYDFNTVDDNVIKVINLLEFTENSDTLVGTEGDDVFISASLDRIQAGDSADGQGDSYDIGNIGPYTDEGDADDDYSDSSETNDGHNNDYVFNNEDSEGGLHGDLLRLSFSVDNPHQNLDVIFNHANLDNIELMEFNTDQNVEFSGIGWTIASLNPELFVGPYAPQLQELSTDDGNDVLSDMRQGLEYYLNGGDDALELSWWDSKSLVDDAIDGGIGNDQIPGEDGDRTFIDGGSDNDSVYGSNTELFEDSELPFPFFGIGEDVDDNIEISNVEYVSDDFVNNTSVSVSAEANDWFPQDFDDVIVNWNDDLSDFGGGDTVDVIATGSQDEPGKSIGVDESDDEKLGGRITLWNIEEIHGTDPSDGLDNAIANDDVQHGNDWLVADGEDGVIWIDGEGGQDSLEVGLEDSPVIASVFGGWGNDTIEAAAQTIAIVYGDHSGEEWGVDGGTDGERTYNPLGEEGQDHITVTASSWIAVYGDGGEDNSGEDDVIDATATGTDGQVYAEGNGGDDEIDVSADVNNGHATVFGNDGDDTIDVIADQYAYVEGGDGQDEITVDPEYAVVFGDDEDDSVGVNTASGNYATTVPGGTLLWDDAITVEFNNSTVGGNSANDGEAYIEGGKGSDTIDVFGGEGGLATILGGVANDTVGNPSKTTLFNDPNSAFTEYRDGDDSITIHSFDEDEPDPTSANLITTITGGAGDDTIGIRANYGDDGSLNGTDTLVFGNINYGALQKVVVDTQGTDYIDGFNFEEPNPGDPAPAVQDLMNFEAFLNTVTYTVTVPGTWAPGITVDANGAGLSGYNSIVVLSQGNPNFVLTGANISVSVPGTIQLADNGRAVIVVGKDEQGPGSDIGKWDIYFVQDIDTGLGTQTWRVNKVAAVDSLTRVGVEAVMNNLLDGMTLLGTPGDDLLVGGLGSQTILGMGGNDTLNGGPGVDSLDGGDGDDVYKFASAEELAEDEAVVGGPGTDTILMDPLTLDDTDFTNVSEVEILALEDLEGSTVTLGAEMNQAFATGITVTTLPAAAYLNLNGSAVAWTRTINATGTDNADTLVGGSAADTLNGALGADSISAREGDDIIVGDQSDVLLDGGANTDILQIGANFNDASDAQIVNIETVALTAAGLTVSLDAQTEGFTINGFAAGASTIIGGAGADLITGGTGADSINGGGGADVIVGSQEDALLDGDAGVDVLQIGANFNDASDAQIAEIEQVALTAAGLTVSLDAQTENLTIIGFAAGASTITGGAGTDVITGGTGADSLNGGGGVDVIVGLAGNDTIVGDQSDALLDGGADTDLLQIGANFNDINDAQIAGIEQVALTVTGLTVVLDQQTEGLTITGFAAGASTITGGAGADVITGGTGADSLNGGGGADNISAGAGNDTIVGDQSDTLLDGGADTDLLQIGASFNDGSDAQIANIEQVALTAGGLTVTLDAQTEGLTINGFAAGASTITGGAGADTITGGTGADNLNGGGGADSIIGGTGVDSLTGQLGIDTFVFSPSDTGVTFGTTDTITDFNGDILQFLGVPAKFVYGEEADGDHGGIDTAGSFAFALAEANTFFGTAPTTNTQYYFVGDTDAAGAGANAGGWLFVDYTGTDEADMAIQLTGVLAANIDTANIV